MWNVLTVFESNPSTFVGGGHLGRYNRSPSRRKKWQTRQTSAIDRTGDTSAMLDSKRDLHESAKPARVGSPYQDLR